MSTPYAIERTNRDFARRLELAGITTAKHALTVINRGERRVIEQWTRQLQEWEARHATKVN